MSEIVPVAAPLQNPAADVEAVSERESLVLNGSNRPVADRNTHPRGYSASPTVLSEALLRTRADPGWVADLADGRAEGADDPWADRVTGAVLDTLKLVLLDQAGEVAPT